MPSQGSDEDIVKIEIVSGGDSFWTQVPVDATVAEIKTSIRLSKGYPRSHQALFLGDSGVPLDDDTLVKSMASRFKKGTLRMYLVLEEGEHRT
jgi:hypothetical protein